MHSNDIKGSWVWLRGVMCSPGRLPLACIFSLRGGFKSLRRMNPPKKQDYVIAALALGSFFAIYCFVSLIDSPFKDWKKESWLISLAFNLIGYSAIVIPGVLILKYVHQTQYLETGPKLLSPLIKLCYFGNNDDSIEESIKGTKNHVLKMNHA